MNRAMLAAVNELPYLRSHASSLVIRSRKVFGERTAAASAAAFKGQNNSCHAVRKKGTLNLYLK